jgi:hypothetical protein
MAARRERERRRPSGERRYRFATPETALPPDQAVVEAGADGDAVDSVEALEEAPPARPRRGTSATATRAAPPRPSAKPFSAYKDEYAYVGRDLRRVGVVIGSLLVILIVLYFVLPLLVR